MDPIICTICQKTNTKTEGQLVVVASFAQVYQVKDALFALEKAHIVPFWIKKYSKDEIEKNGMFLACETLVMQFHGIKDIIQLQALFVESMCREQGALTCDIISRQVSQQKILSSLS